VTLHKSSITKPDIGRKSLFLPNYGVNIAIRFGMEKRELCGLWLPDDQNFEDMIIRFDTIHECD